MQKRYEAALAKPNQYGEWNVVSTRRFRTVERARRQCESWLAAHPTVRTRYVGTRLEWCADVRDIKTGRMLEVVEAPVEIVPSAGELGYW